MGIARGGGSRDAPGAVGRALWRSLNAMQHSSALGRRVVQALTRPIRYRDLRVRRGRMAGMRINLGGSFVRYLTGDAEPEVQQALAELVKPGQTVYDVGANIGFFTILCSRLVGPQGRVYAFEPIPQNLVTLRHNIALNGLTNVVIVDKALSALDRYGRDVRLAVVGVSLAERRGGDQTGQPRRRRRGRSWCRRSRSTSSSSGGRAAAGSDQDRCRGGRADRRRGHARDAAIEQPLCSASSTTQSSRTAISSTRSTTGRG